MLVEKRKHGLIKITKKILNIDADITYDHVNILKNKIQNMLNNGYTPKEIKEKYSIKYSDFGMFIKKSLNLTIKSHIEAALNFNIKNGNNIDKKILYKHACAFTFNPYDYTSIPGYKLLLEYGIYHPISNPNGMCRDHIVSKEYGWRNNIDPSIISHPANCQYITNYENIKKGTSSDLTIDQLMNRIKTLDFSTQITNEHKHLPKTTEHKNKISKTIKLQMCITNGKINKKILKTDTIPFGFWRGLTRKNKMIS